MLDKLPFSSLLRALLLGSVLMIIPQFSSGSAGTQENELPRLFAITSSDTGVKEVPLKGIRQDSEVTKANNFKIDYYNIIQIQQGQNLVLFTDSSAQGFRINEAMLVNVQDQTTKLVPLSGTKYFFVKWYTERSLHFKGNWWPG